MALMRRRFAPMSGCTVWCTGGAASITSGGTVVLEVAEGGIEVPSFIGKSLRAAMEAALNSGLELDAVGSGVAREQAPAAGAHVAAGSRVRVRFGR